MPDNNFVNIMLISGNINYFNRIIKKYDTLAEYQALGSYYTTTVNFDPGNNLQTTLVLGTSGVNALTYDCNYLLVYTTTNNTTTIQQRWWVMDQKRTRAGQYTLSLKRDVIADFYDIVTEAPCFIEKATIRDDSNPLIFNKEDMTFNQIKKSETFLKDETKCAWIVGYVARNYTGETFTSTYDVRADLIKVDNEHPVLPLYTSYCYASNIRMGLHIKHHETVVQGGSITYKYQNYLEWPNDKLKNDEVTIGVQTQLIPQITSLSYYPYQVKTVNGNIIVPSAQDMNHIGRYVSTTISSLNYDNSITNLLAVEAPMEHGSTQEFVDTYIMPLNGKIYKDASVTPNKYYKINVSLLQEIKTFSIKSTSGLGYAIRSAVLGPVTENMIAEGDYENPNGYSEIRFTQNRAVWELEEFNPESFSITLSNARNRLNDAPYDMFCIPYPVDSYLYAMYEYTDDEHYKAIQINALDSLHIAQAIAAKLGPNEFIYDIQILPYCPIKNLMKTYEIGFNIYEKCMDLISMSVNSDYNIVYNTDANPKAKSVILWSNYSSNTFDINKEIIVQNPKIENETKLYRLVSPNYSGMFEFSPAQNGGVNYFNVDFTYKPYSPYIHVNPNFKNLYGSDFNDIRGLVCGGDFTIAMVDDKWANFEINNKNYQMIFDREVKNLNFTREQERVKEIVGIGAGTAQGVAQGAAMGGWAGAIAGGVTSAAGGAFDFIMSEQKYKENLNLKKDLYNYNLGNIKALPSSLVKSMSLTANYKFWPFLEEYECSEVEKIALENKLKYDGMTIMTIGKMSDYIIQQEKTFIKGQLIRLENLPEASDVAYEIYNEIKRGVFI